MIPTFIFNAEQRQTYLESNGYNTLDLSPGSILNGQSKFDNLTQAIKWAAENDEDVIYCICERYPIEELNLNDIELALRDIISAGAHMLYVHTANEKNFAISQFCRVAHEVDQVFSFLIAKPLYEIINSFVGHLNKSQTCMPWLEFLQHLNPNRFAFTTPSNYCKPDQNELPIHIISPFRNAYDYIKYNFNSIKSQAYQNYRLHYIDDASDDFGLTLIPDEAFISKRTNKVRRYALQNIVDVLLNSGFSDNDIICLVDADDYLPHKYVLKILNQAYQQEDIMLTYGSMQNHKGNRNIGSKYTRTEFENIRKSPWRVSHIRSFRYCVFKKYLEFDPNLEMLKDIDDKVLKMPYDMALLFPMMELIEYDQVIFLSNLMYKYRLHQYNDTSNSNGEQIRGEEVVRSKSKINVNYRQKNN